MQIVIRIICADFSARNMEFALSIVLLLDSEQTTNWETMDLLLLGKLRMEYLSNL